MIAAPPLSAGAVQCSVAVVPETVAVRPVGADGATAGTRSAAEGADGWLEPLLLAAVTVNVYDWPRCRPETPAVRSEPVAVAVEAAEPPEDAVTVKRVMAAPPAASGG